MNPNPLHWRRTLGNIARSDLIGADYLAPGTRAVGVPVLGAPCPPEIRVPLRAVLRQSFLAGNREAPLVDALADVEGWEECDEERMTKARAPRVQIVIPVRGAHEALRLCLSCVGAHTPGLHPDGETPRVDLVLADEEFDAVADIECTSVGPDAWAAAMHRTPAPQSFAANVNLGASRSRSEFLVLLNSDAYVGPGWLDALLAPFADSEVVAVGPMGTAVSGHQNAPWPINEEGDPVPSTAEEVAAAQGHWTFTGPFRDGKSRAPYPARRLVGFCLAVRRSAWDRVGGMDERFANAFDDDDLSLRLSLVGKCVVVPDLLVIHAGQASFRELPDWTAAYNRTLDENRRRFVGKWSWIFKEWSAWMDERGWR